MNTYGNTKASHRQLDALRLSLGQTSSLGDVGPGEVSDLDQSVVVVQRGTVVVRVCDELQRGVRGS